MRHVTRFIVMAAALAATHAFAALPDSFSPVLEPVMPAVVNISTTQKVAQPGAATFNFEGLPNDPNNQQFRDMFREFNERFGNQMQNTEREVTSLGSGFVIDPNGYVVTNSHVIANAENITVIFADDKRLPASVVGVDAKTDLALLKVKTDKKLTAVKFGDSDALRVGDWVIAVGNPFGLGGSVSAGIVSARGRNIHAGPFDDFIQTDAAINRGNSGGPLFNIKGEVVGINAAIFSPTGGNIGIGFAVPSVMARPIIEQLRAHGKVQRAWLGVKIQDITEDIAEALNLGGVRGSLVLEVAGPATHSGIEPGDVIITFGGHDVKTNGLPRLVAESTIGKKVDITVWRKGKEHTYSVKLGELPAEKQKKILPSGVKGGATEEVAAPKSQETFLGMALVPVTQELRQRVELPKGANGLLVASIEPMSEAARRGMQPGDFIVEVNQQPVESVKSLKAGLDAAKSAGRAFALLKVNRRTTAQYIAIPAK